MLAVGGGRLVAVGGGWWRLVVGGWWLMAVGSGWQLAAVGGWRLVAVGGWRLAVPKGGPEKNFSSLRTPLAQVMHSFECIVITSHTQCSLPFLSRSQDIEWTSVPPCCFQKMYFSAVQL